MSFGPPEETEEERRRRLAAERRARRDRMMANQDFTQDRTAHLIRQFGRRTGGTIGTPTPRTILARQDRG